MAFDPEAVRAFEHAGWEKAADTYNGTFAHASRQFAIPLLEAARVSAGCTVLDIACGTGIASSAAAERGAVVTGVDFSAAMLAMARRRHPALRFDCSDAEALPYPSGSFQAAVSNFGIHHVPHPDRALSEARRVLRTGGRLAFSIWDSPVRNMAWKLVFDAVRRCGDPAASPAPAPGGGFASAEDAAAALQQAGFAEIGCHFLTGIWRHRDAAALLHALQAGTARMAGLIGSQPAAARPAIIADIEQHAAQWRDPEGLAVPIAAIVASGAAR